MKYFKIVGKASQTTRIKGINVLCLIYAKESSYKYAFINAKKWIYPLFGVKKVAGLISENYQLTELEYTLLEDK